MFGRVVRGRAAAGSGRRVPGGATNRPPTMAAVLALLSIALLSLLAVRVGATALMMTGLSWDSASFQAYSAFFGVGFTTREAEMVVNHPIRRRIIRDLILVGNIGITSALATLVVTLFQADTSRHLVTTMVFVLGGIVGLYLLGKIPFVEKALDFVIRRTLARAGVTHALDYELLLRVESGYCISEVEVLPDCELAGRTLKESHPASWGLIVLGIARRDGSFRGAPNADERVEVGDVLTVYGKEEVISEFAKCGVRAPGVFTADDGAKPSDQTHQSSASIDARDRPTQAPGAPGQESATALRPSPTKGT